MMMMKKKMKKKKMKMKMKMKNYSALLNTHFFVPLALDTLGPINITGQNFLSDLGRKLTTSTGGNRETCFLLQRLSITIHHTTF